MRYMKMPAKPNQTNSNLVTHKNSIQAFKTLDSTHIGGLFVVVYVVHVSGQTKVSNLHHVVLRHQNVPGRQVSMDTLRTHIQRTGHHY